MLTLILIIIIIIILIKVIPRSYKTGKIGEGILAIHLSKITSQYDLSLINNLIIPSNNGTTQIDHILVGKMGIIVVETKNYSGWIFGDKNSKTWTQTFYKNKYQFQNPLHQNYKHLMSLSEILKIPPQRFHSLVVFLDRCQFKTTMPDNVIHPDQINNWIENQNRTILSDIEIQNIISKLDKLKLNMTFLDGIRHSRSLKKNINNKTK